MRRPDSESPDSLTRVRAARREATPAEQKLWTKLRNRQLHGLKFRRQVWLGREGFRVVRVANADVMQNIDGALEYVAGYLPSPSQS